ncbi:hypothetical protein [Methanoculleus sp.]|uniref:hypothetical protein n=1 Tax=Methanoculleus sp. TaxID=90427 RepID=UPI0025D1F568|nr:hypothetical protein [Methanoculleus sp.]
MERTGTAVITLVLLCALVSWAWAIPTLPCAFQGSVTIDGNPAPAGTTVAALIDGETRGEITTTEIGKYGDYMELGDKLVVGGDGEDAGKTIRFTVNGVYAGETATFTAGDGRRLDLSVSTGGSGPSSGGGGSSSAGGSGTTAQSTTPTTGQTPGAGELQTTSTGTVTRSVTVTTEDRTCTLAVASGVAATGADGKPLREVAVETVSEDAVPPVPDGATYAFAGRAVKCEPAGAVFSPAVTLTFTLSEEEWSHLRAADLSVRWYDAAAGEWVDLPVEVDAATRMVTAKVSHFSVFALFTGETASSQAVETPLAGASVGETGAPAGGPRSDSIPWVALAGIPVLIVVVGAIYIRQRRKNSR